MSHKKKVVRSKKPATSSINIKQLGKVEKTFLAIPQQLLKEIKKELSLTEKQQKTTSRTIMNTTKQRERMSHKLNTYKSSQKPIKRSLINSVTKQYKNLTSLQRDLLKQQQTITESLVTLKGFADKFNALHQHLNEFRHPGKKRRKNRSIPQLSIISDQSSSSLQQGHTDLSNHSH